MNPAKWQAQARACSVLPLSALSALSCLSLSSVLRHALFSLSPFAVLHRDAPAAHAFGDHVAMMES